MITNLIFGLGVILPMALAAFLELRRMRDERIAREANAGQRQRPYVGPRVILWTGFSDRRVR